MLPISNFTITLGKSSTYLKLVCLIHVFAVVVLWNSSLPLYILIIMMLILLVSFILIAYSRVPVPAFNQLSYHKNYWLLHDVYGHTIKYEQAHISFDAGLFVLLTLTGEDASKKLVIFADQLTTSQHRALNVIGKIREKKTEIKKVSR